MTHDPVCGMEVKDLIKAEVEIYKGKTYYFCSASCKEQFKKNPEKYLNKKDSHSGHHH